MSLQSSLDAILARHYHNGNNDKTTKKPGMQVVLVGKNTPNGTISSIIYEGAIGYANSVVEGKEDEELSTHHEANLYSLSKFFTACCILQLIDQGKLHPTDKALPLLPIPLQKAVLASCNNSDYWDATIEDLIAHQAGIPNPLPLQWVHTPDETIDETQLLMNILSKNKIKIPPKSNKKNGVEKDKNNGGGSSSSSSSSSEKANHTLPCQYSNVGYWILGHIVTNICGESSSNFAKCCRTLLSPSSLSSKSGFNTDEIKFPSDTFNPSLPMQYGHVPYWSTLSLVANLLCPSKLIGPNNRQWIRMNPHLIDGVSYGGLISSSRTVATWLGSLLDYDVNHQNHNEVKKLETTSSSISPPEDTKATATKVLSTTSMSQLWKPINDEMTFGLHIRKHNGLPIYHKEGGGAGCHSTIQIRPHTSQLAGCLISGDATMNVNDILQELMDCVEEYQNEESKRQSSDITKQTKNVKSNDGTSIIHAKIFSDSDDKKIASSTTNNNNNNNCDPILLIHGGPGVPSDYLEDLAVLLIQSNITTTVITYDQRGVGLSSSLSSKHSTSMNHFLEDIESIRKELQLSKLNIMGHSWGGIIARLYTEKYSEYVSSMVLLSPTTVLCSSDWSKMEEEVMMYNLRKGGWWNFLKLGIWSLLIHFPFIDKFASQNLFQHVIKNYYFDPITAPNPTKEFLKGVSGTAMITSKQAFVTSVTKPISFPNERIKHKSLCIFGENDIYGKNLIESFCNNFQNNNEVQKEGRDITKILPLCGHLSWVDQPISLTRCLKEFYETILKEN